VEPTELHPNVQVGQEPEDPEEKVSQVDPEIGLPATTEASEEEEPFQPSEEVVQKYQKLIGTFATKLKEDGWLPDDVEVESADLGDIYDAYRRRNESRLIDDTNEKVRQSLMNMGYDEQTLAFARAIANGEDLRNLSLVTMHQKYANMDDGVSDEEKLASIRFMYKAKAPGLKEDELQELIDRVEEKEKIDEVFNDSVSFHAQQEKTWRENEEAASKQREQMLEQQEAQFYNLFKGVLERGEAAGEKISQSQAKEIDRDYRNYTEIVEIGNVKHKVTGIKKFLIDIQTNPEALVRAYKLYKYRNQDVKEIEQKAQRELADDIIATQQAAIMKQLGGQKVKQGSKSAEATPERMPDRAYKLTF